ncbi:cyclic di-AMP binding protein CbpA [Leuconostocaceae bacterium ESL0723]|nr:cyclic di-AMP binding protein CbpA [Lactobacillaceae bacterium L1_55_11]WEV54248.1 cyclic di-AMP binding protein CbpA [Leuconostocaceae bacterium ESL0723]
MFPKSLVIPKAQLTTITEDTTIQEVYEIFNRPEEAHSRTIPILDQSGQLFRGNVYKQHVFEAVANGEDLSQPATAIMRNSTKFIFTNSKFYEVFFAIRDLPFIAVLDEDHHFYGIFTHSTLMDLLSQSWSLEKGGVALSVRTHEMRGDLEKISKTITRYTNIESVLSIQADETTSLTLMFTLPLTIEDPQLDKLIQKLNKKHFQVTNVENLSQFK